MGHPAGLTVQRCRERRISWWCTGVHMYAYGLHMCGWRLLEVRKMARIKWVQQRLDNWGMWASRGGAGSAGYASKCVLARWAESDAWERNCYGSLVIPVSESEALETDRAITSFKDTRRPLARALVLVYVMDLGVVEAALRERVAVSTMHARLSQADMAIAMWLEDRAEEAKRRQVTAHRGFTG